MRNAGRRGMKVALQLDASVRRHSALAVRSRGVPSCESTRYWTNGRGGGGCQGVPWLVVIRGVSLTLAEEGARGGLRGPGFFLARFGKLIVAYWASRAVAYGVMEAAAWRQLPIGDGSFADDSERGVSISVL